MVYRLVQLTLDSDEEIEISEHEFVAIKDARDVVWAALGSEQKFDIAIENYYEFEREILELSLQHSFAMMRSWEAYAHDRQRVERRLGNLTFATRLLLDQMKHDAASLLGRRTDALAKLDATREAEEKTLPHRTLQVLRDRIQHHSFPEIGIVYNGGWEGREGSDDPPRRLHGWLDLRLPVSELKGGQKRDDKRARELAEELEAAAIEEIDFLDYVRKHVESVARIHGCFQELLEPRRAAAEELFLASIARGCQELGLERDKAVGLAAVKLRQNGSVEEEVHLFEQPVRYARTLRAKNRGLESISRRFVSGVSATLMPPRKGRGPKRRA